MKKLLLLLIVPGFIFAQNTPCSGRKGGIAYCDGSYFVCKNGTYSASKKICSGYNQLPKRNHRQDYQDDTVILQPIEDCVNLSTGRVCNSDIRTKKKPTQEMLESQIQLLTEKESENKFLESQSLVYKNKLEEIENNQDTINKLTMGISSKFKYNQAEAQDAESQLRQINSNIDKNNYQIIQFRTSIRNLERDIEIIDYSNR